MQILPLQPAGVSALTAEKAAPKTAGSGFGEMLEKSIGEVNQAIQEADTLSAGLASGEHGRIHETMIAIEKADISFKLMTKMQQKAIAAYESVMRIQL
jgi:flagellar hook-basal body complex protein FliE